MANAKKSPFSSKLSGGSYNRPPESNNKPKSQASGSTAAQATTIGSRSNSKGEMGKTSQPRALSIKDQQRILDIFANAFQEQLSSPGFGTAIQGIKTALFNRDFASAFGNEASLPVYAARWSPTRAICYASVLQDPNGTKGHLLDMLSKHTEDKETTLKMVALGGGAAELAALASLTSDPAFESKKLVAIASLIDSGPWGETVRRLYGAITTAPVLSKYASAAAKAANTALAETRGLRLEFQQGDILNLDKDQLVEMGATIPVLVTLLFTLNELYTAAGIGETTAFLLRLGECLAPGSLLLVVDSPGSYSEAAVGKEKKRYPMQWLLDHTLLGNNGGGETGGDARWEKLEGKESVWLRLEEALRYPIALENMRYQMHLYRVRKSEL